MSDTHEFRTWHEPENGGRDYSLPADVVERSRVNIARLAAEALRKSDTE